MPIRELPADPTMGSERQAPSPNCYTPVRVFCSRVMLREKSLFVALQPY